MSKQLQKQFKYQDCKLSMAYFVACQSLVTNLLLIRISKNFSKNTILVKINVSLNKVPLAFGLFLSIDRKCNPWTTLSVEMQPNRVLCTSIWRIA